MGDTDSLREQYDRFVQDIYRDILKKKGFGKAHGAFVKIESGIVHSVEFTCYPDKKSKKKDTLMFRIFVEARLENETQLRREGKLTTGEGAYRKFFPGLPKQNFWTGRLQYSEEDLRIIKAFRIQRQTDLAGLKVMVKNLLNQTIRDMMQFPTEQELVAYLNAEREAYMETLEAGQRRHVLFAFSVYGILGVIACIVSRDWFPLTFVSILYYEIILKDMDLSDRWFRRLLAVPVIELLVMSVLWVLLWQKVTDDFAAGKLCISLFLSGLVHLVDHIYNRYVRKKIKELLNNRRFWGGA